MMNDDRSDWRSLEASLALDVSLIQSVFYNLAMKESTKEALGEETRNKDNEVRPDDRDKELEQMMFSKAVVLLTLEGSEGFLAKRPWLRVLHTQLACVSCEKEGRNVHDFIRRRQQDRSVCLRDVRRKLESIYDKAKIAKEVEDKRVRGIAQARLVSPWCVREPKYLHPSPARKLYRVHRPPPCRVTEETRKEVVTSYAHALVKAAVSHGLEMVLVRCKFSTSDRIEKDATHAKIDLLRPSCTLRTQREQTERSVELQRLRLELLAPTANFALDHSQVTINDELTRVMMQLATVEAQGDARLARQVLEHANVQSGFRRAAEQAKRLGISSQVWKVVKLWHGLYRSATLQALVRPPRYSSRILLEESLPHKDHTLPSTKIGKTLTKVDKP